MEHMHFMRIYNKNHDQAYSRHDVNSGREPIQERWLCKRTVDRGRFSKAMAKARRDSILNVIKSSTHTTERTANRTLRPKGGGWRATLIYFIG